MPKAFVFAALLISLTSAHVFASEMPKNLNCTLNAYYLNISNKMTIPLNGESVTHSEKDGNRMISWSRTECEDITQVTFKSKDYQDLLSGRIQTAYADLYHAEPDAEIKGVLECELAK